MKTREIRSYVPRHELPEAQVFGSSKGWRTVRQALLVEITTDEGLSGFGEAYGPPPPNRALVDELYGPRLLGRDPLGRAVIWEDLDGTFRDYGRKGWAVAGFRAMKMKDSFGVDEDVKNVSAVRAAIGPDRLLAVDANHAWDAGQAIRFGRKVEGARTSPGSRSPSCPRTSTATAR